MFIDALLPRERGKAEKLRCDPRVDIIGIYRILNGLLFISGLRGLIGRANRSSSVVSSPPSVFAAAAAGARAVPLSTMASREAAPAPPDAGCRARAANDETAKSDAAGDSEVIRGRVRGWALFAAVSKR